jgi:hypothetical protein
MMMKRERMRKVGDVEKLRMMRMNKLLILMIDLFIYLWKVVLCCDICLSNKLYD